MATASSDEKGEWYADPDDPTSSDFARLMKLQQLSCDLVWHRAFSPVAETIVTTFYADSATVIFSKTLDTVKEQVQDAPDKVKNLAIATPH